MSARRALKCCVASLFQSWPLFLSHSFSCTVWHIFTSFSHSFMLVWTSSWHSCSWSNDYNITKCGCVCVTCGCECTWYTFITSGLLWQLTARGTFISPMWKQLSSSMNSATRAMGGYVPGPVHLIYFFLVGIASVGHFI